MNVKFLPFPPSTSKTAFPPDRIPNSVTNFFPPTQASEIVEKKSWNVYEVLVASVTLLGMRNAPRTDLPFLLRSDRSYL